MKNKSVKLPFVTKNSKHLVGTSGDDVSALIEFTPLWKTKVSLYFCMQQEQSNRYLYLLYTFELF